MKPKILLVDDSPIDLELAVCVLESLYDVHTCTSGEESIQLVRKLRPDLILLDVVMPVMDGFNVCKKLKSADDTAFIPIIFLSALGQFTDRLGGFACGAEDYITKPFDEDEIIKKINSCLSRVEAQKALYKQYLNNRGNDNTLENKVERVFELSALVNFHRNCDQATTYKELGHSVLETCQMLGFDVNIQLETRNGMEYIGCRDKSIESLFLHQSTRKFGKLFSRSRSIFHKEKVTLLIKNIPLDDPISSKNTKQCLQAIVEATSERLAVIDYKSFELRSRQEQYQHMENANKIVTKHLQKHNSHVKEDIGDLVYGLKTYVHSLDIDPLAFVEFDKILEKIQSKLEEVDNPQEEIPSIRRVFDDFMNE